MRKIGGLQFDNDPEQKRKLAQEYLKKHKIATLNGPHIFMTLILSKIFGKFWEKIIKENTSTQSKLIELVNQEIYKKNWLIANWQLNRFNIR